MGADFIGSTGRLRAVGAVAGLVCASVIAATAGPVGAEVVTDGSVGPRVRLNDDVQQGKEAADRKWQTTEGATWPAVAGLGPSRGAF